METLKYIINAIIQFFKSSNATTKTNAVDSGNVEITHAKFGINLKPASGKAASPLLSLMYSEENETLFI